MSGLGATTASAAPARGDTTHLASADKARLLHRWAEEAMDEGTVESRQRAIRDLELAIQLDPANAGHWLTLGRIYAIGESPARARDCFDNAMRLAPRDPEPRMERGRLWKRDWVRWLAPLSLTLAMTEFDAVTQLRPNGSEAWLALVPLRYERTDLAGAAEAADRALAGRPRVAEAALAVAYIAYRRGDIERADTLFRQTIPKLQPDLRRLFENAAPILGLPGAAAGEEKTQGKQAPPPTAQGSVSGDAPEDAGPSIADAAPPTPAEVWDGIDPDPTTPENETRLEFWARVAHAYFLFWDPLEPTLDSRADLYVRYGPPHSIEINPGDVPGSYKPNIVSTGRAASLADYPMGVVRWNYPQFGMQIVLNDRSLHGRFTPAVSRDFQWGSTPDPGVLAHRGDLQALDGGRAIFPTLPTRDLLIETAGMTARFENGSSPRLFAQVQAIATPADTLAARWVVQDFSGRTVAKGGGHLAVSACDPASRQVAELSQELPPGHYRLAVSVHGSGHRRSLFRAPVEVLPPEEDLSLSDMVLSCGAPTGGSSIRLDANVESIVTGSGPIVVYFEIYRLTAAPDGLAHFEVQYAVRRLSEAGKKRREPALLSSTSRDEAQLAGLRRQYVTVPSSSLAPGRYQLEIRVRDLTAQTQAEGIVPFDRE